MLLLILESEGCLYASSLVQESSPHVDVTHIPQIPTNNVHTHMEEDVSQQLLPEPGAQLLLPAGAPLVVDDVVAGGAGAHRQHRDTHPHTQCHPLPGYGQEQVDEEEVED